MSSVPTSSTCPACPYLGSQQDSAVHYGFPVCDNLCFAEKTVATIPLDHQGRTCLTNAHTGCSYCQDAVSRYAPSAAARAEVSKAPVTRKQRVISTLLFSALGAGGVLVLVMLILWAVDASFVGRLHLMAPAAANAAGERPGAAVPAAPAATQTPSPRATATVTPSPTTAPTDPPTASPAPTQTLRSPILAAATAVVEHVTRVVVICTPAPTPAPTPFLIVAVPALNLRERSAANAPVTQVAYNGDRLAVSGRDESAAWVQTCCLGGWPGWVMVRHVNLSVPVLSLPVVSLAPTAAAPLP